MSQAVTVELPDSVYKAVREAADATGNTPAEWIAVQIPYLLSTGSGKVPQPGIPDEIVALLSQLAPQLKKPVEKLASEWLSRYGPQPRPQLSEQEQQAARERLQQHFGAVNLGHPTGTDNKDIDADLAREYDSTHE